MTERLMCFAPCDKWNVESGQCSCQQAIVNIILQEMEEESCSIRCSDWSTDDEANEEMAKSIANKILNQFKSPTP